MKRILASALILASIGSASFAAGGNEKMSLGLQQRIHALVPNADLNDLSNNQIAAIYGVFSRAGNDSSFAAEAGMLKSILGRE